MKAIDFRIVRLVAVQLEDRLSEARSGLIGQSYLAHTRRSRVVAPATENVTTPAVLIEAIVQSPEANAGTVASAAVRVPVIAVSTMPWSFVSNVSLSAPTLRDQR